MFYITGMPGKDGVECPVMCPVNCGSEEHACWGGVDANDCMMPDFCIPMKDQCPTPDM